MSRSLTITYARFSLAMLASLLLVLLAFTLGEPIFLRFNINLWQLAVASGLVLLTLVYVHKLPWSALAWLVLSLMSILWSLSPAASLRASIWHSVYVAVLLAGIAFPRYILAAFIAVNGATLMRGVDLLIVTQRDDFNGVWYQQNIQGSQLLLVAPVLAFWTTLPSRWAVYVALPLGFIVFLSGLTFSTASQILLVLGVGAVWAWRRQSLANKRLPMFFLFAVGMGLAWLLTQPQSAQVFTINLGNTPTGVRVSDPVNTLLARVHLIEDVGKRAWEALPLGTGVGSLRDIYSHLQRHEIESVDAHNYYLQTLLTLGLFGLPFLVILFWGSVRAAFQAKQIGIATALVLFMGYLAFDVMAYYPGIMVLFFALMGVARGLLPHQHAATSDTTVTHLSLQRATKFGLAAYFIVLPLFWWWWLQPCQDIACFAGRKLADPVAIGNAVLAPEERLQWASIGKARYPETLFYARLYASTQQQLEETPQVMLYRDIAQRFPAADLGVYRDWRDAAIQAGDFAEALEASRESLIYFKTDNDLIMSN